MTQIDDDLDQPLFFTMIGNKSPTIMCLAHAQAFERMMMVHEIPHTIYELDEPDNHVCQACELANELNKPRIILPH